MLDCTLGLGSDAIIASLAAGEQGEVRGIEKARFSLFLSRRGFNRGRPALTFGSGDERIRVHSGDSIDYLLELDDASADIVYFDPMFDDGIKESDGIAPLRKWAHSEFTLDGALHEALRVARKEWF
ncbi:class I SAM-dependent methyltransferase [Bacillus licheniformis]|nr:class I SAM-dependent methyltransferase [Bacillus licheniformis]